MNDTLPVLIFLCGIAQLSVLVASALVPAQLNWKKELQSLARLHRQMYWVYGGYVVLSIIAFGLISLFNYEEISSGSMLARSFCAYVAIFWGIRLCLQAVFDVKSYLDRWYLRIGYHLLSLLFAFFTAIYAYAALQF